MKAETTANLVESYLLTTNKYIKPNRVTLKEVKSDYTPHFLVKFKCMGTGYEVKVFAPDFMLFKVEGMPGKVCTNLSEIKDQIDFLLDSSLADEFMNSEF